MNKEAIPAKFLAAGGGGENIGSVLADRLARLNDAGGKRAFLAGIQPEAFGLVVRALLSNQRLLSEAVGFLSDKQRAILKEEGERRDWQGSNAFLGFCLFGEPDRDCCQPGLAKEEAIRWFFGEFGPAAERPELREAGVETLLGVWIRNGALTNRQEELRGNGFFRDLSGELRGAFLAEAKKKSSEVEERLRAAMEVYGAGGEGCLEITRRTVGRYLDSQYPFNIRYNGGVAARTILGEKLAEAVVDSDRRGEWLGWLLGQGLIRKDSLSVEWLLVRLGFGPTELREQLQKIEIGSELEQLALADRFSVRWLGERFGQFGETSSAAAVVIPETARGKFRAEVKGVLSYWRRLLNERRRGNVFPGEVEEIDRGMADFLNVLLVWFGKGISKDFFRRSDARWWGNRLTELGRSLPTGAVELFCCFPMSMRKALISYEEGRGWQGWEEIIKEMPLERLESDCGLGFTGVLGERFERILGPVILRRGLTESLEKRGCCERMTMERTEKYLLPFWRWMAEFARKYPELAQEWLTKEVREKVCDLFQAKKRAVLVEERKELEPFLEIVRGIKDEDLARLMETKITDGGRWSVGLGAWILAVLLGRERVVFENQRWQARFDEQEKTDFSYGEPAWLARLVERTVRLARPDDKECWPGLAKAAILAGEWFSLYPTDEAREKKLAKAGGEVAGEVIEERLGRLISLLDESGGRIDYRGAVRSLREMQVPRWLNEETRSFFRQQVEQRLNGWLAEEDEGGNRERLVVAAAMIEGGLKIGPETLMSLVDSLGGESMSGEVFELIYCRLGEEILQSKNQEWVFRYFTSLIVNHENTRAYAFFHELESCNRELWGKLSKEMFERLPDDMKKGIGGASKLGKWKLFEQYLGAAVYFDDDAFRLNNVLRKRFVFRKGPGYKWESF